MERKLAVFERRGGLRARQLAEAFWGTPSAETFQPYWDECHALYNTRPNPETFSGTRMIARPEILFHFAAGEIRTMDLAPGLAKAQCPVLVMAGEEDPVCPIEDSEDIVAALPPPLVKFARFPRVGHGAWRDDPEAAFRVLREYIEG